MMRNWRVLPTKEEQAEVHTDESPRPIYRELHEKAVNLGSVSAPVKDVCAMLSDLEDWATETILRKYPECKDVIVLIATECMNKDGKKNLSIETNDFLGDNRTLDIENYMLDEFRKANIVAWFYYNR